MEATYEATLAVAACLARERGGERVKVFLTDFGCGDAFERKEAALAYDALRRACDAFASAPLDLALVHPGDVPEVRGLPAMTFLGQELRFESRIKGLPTLVLNSDFGWARGPHESCNYLLPGGCLLAGSYPGDRHEPGHSRKIRACVEAGGVDCFLCLQERGELTNRFRPYIAQAQVESNALKTQGRRGGGSGSGAAGLGVEFLHCPIPDGGVTSDELLLEAVAVLVDRLTQGRTVYVHCWGGHGRTGTLLAALLVKVWGLTVDQARRYFMAAHDTRDVATGGGNPSWPGTHCQYEQVERLAKDGRALPNGVCLGLLEDWEQGEGDRKDGGSVDGFERPRRVYGPEAPRSALKTRHRGDLLDKDTADAAARWHESLGTESTYKC
jgi:hypothetical protein